MMSPSALCHPSNDLDTLDCPNDVLLIFEKSEIAVLCGASYNKNIRNDFKAMPRDESFFNTNCKLSCRSVVGAVSSEMPSIVEPLSGRLVIHRRDRRAAISLSLSICLFNPRFVLSLSFWLLDVLRFQNESPQRNIPFGPFCTGSSAGKLFPTIELSAIRRNESLLFRINPWFIIRFGSNIPGRQAKYESLTISDTNLTPSSRFEPP
jgi:hypothetical protein